MINQTFPYGKNVGGMVGTIINRTLVVTGCDCDDKSIKGLHKLAKKLQSEHFNKEWHGEVDLVSDLVGGMNGIYTFMVGTTGSKEGWGLAEAQKEMVGVLIDEIDKIDDGSFDYFYIAYGNDLPYLRQNEELKYEMLDDNFDKSRFDEE
jgi:hypothetical protein